MNLFTFSDGVELRVEDDGWGLLLNKIERTAVVLNPTGCKLLNGLKEPTEICTKGGRPISATTYNANETFFNTLLDKGYLRSCRS